jgi:hypothetical protein
VSLRRLSARLHKDAGPFVKLFFANMKCAAVCTLVCLALVSPAFALLRPLFPVKSAPPSSGEAIVIGDNLVRGSAKEAPVTRPRLGYAKFYSRSYHAVMRVYNDAGNVIETHEHKGDFKEW